MTPVRPVSYESYLRVPELLAAQVPLSSPESHDELQFIIVHQVYELWFKLLLHEVKSVIAFLQADQAGEALWLLRRSIEIGRVLIQQIHVMETMSPAKFLEFRDFLKPASGLQSAQFRALEFMSGLKDPRYLELYPGSPESRRLLEDALAAPTLWDAFCDLLLLRGFEAGDHEAQIQALVQVYTRPEHLDLQLLAEAFIEFDEGFRVWRTRHYLMAERMIGFKPGTGVAHTEMMKTAGQSADSLPRGEGGPSFQDPGVQYLKGRADKRFFPALWEVRGHLGGGGYGA
ncbi:MAG: tryptophan 2,3-dioxygenase [Holophagaceae bacterium]|nr:tryptophan 2,3-dioxygenase [Holophagaceae bacterium]